MANSQTNNFPRDHGMSVHNIDYYIKELDKPKKKPKKKKPLHKMSKSMRKFKAHGGNSLNSGPRFHDNSENMKGYSNKMNKLKKKEFYGIKNGYLKKRKFV